MESTRAYRIITNNPLAARLLREAFQVDHRPVTHRQVLVAVRDLVYAGHRLYTHPLAGSLKPNQQPYRSVAVSRAPVGMEAGEAAIIAGSIETYDKFVPVPQEYPPERQRELQLVDYTLLCGALGVEVGSRKGGVLFEIGTGIY